jgi:hypothetical protein
VTKSRRKRCTGPCQQLYAAERLYRVGGRDWLCPDCLVSEAERIAPPATLDEAPIPIPPDPASEPPEPLPLLDEEERFAGMISYDVPGWPLRNGRLSASALGTFLRCPEQFRRQYVLGEKRPSGGTGLAGTGAHGAIEAALRLRAMRGLVASPRQVTDTFDAVYDSAVERANEREGIEWGTIREGKTNIALDYDKAREIGKRAVEAYACSPGYERLQPWHTEEVFSFMVPGVPVPFCGLIDVVTESSVVDLKFGAQTASVVKPDWRIQALVYGFAKRRPAEFHATSWAGAAQSPASHPGLRWPWNPVQALLAADIMRSVVEAILAYAARWPDSAWPGNLSHQWACAKCEFKRDCRWWNVPVSELL